MPGQVTVSPEPLSDDSRITCSGSHIVYRVPSCSGPSSWLVLPRMTATLSHLLGAQRPLLSALCELLGPRCLLPLLPGPAAELLHPRPEVSQLQRHSSHQSVGRPQDLLNLGGERGLVVAGLLSRGLILLLPSSSGSENSFQAGYHYCPIADPLSLCPLASRPPPSPAQLIPTPLLRPEPIPGLLHQGTQPENQGLKAGPRAHSPPSLGPLPGHFLAFSVSCA